MSTELPRLWLGHSVPVTWSKGSFNLLQEAYENGQLKGRQIIEAKRLIEKRQQLGPSSPNAAQIKPPTSSYSLVRTYQKEVERFMEGQLIDLGLFSRADVEKQNPASPLFKKYFMHGVAHHLGLDVHDVWDKYKPFQEGMVLTCEPGIYIQEEGLGIRLENNLVIHKGKNTNLMKNIPLHWEEIEDLMNQ